MRKDTDNDRLDKRQIHEFAEKYCALYSNLRSSDRDFEDGFGEQCHELGFEMDDGEKFIKDYSEKAFYDEKELKKVINEVQDIQLLGDTIFSKWRYITHWAESGFRPEVKQWFLTAFNRLKQLTE